MSEEQIKMIGKYKVVSLIAKGGMGIVYKANHPLLKRYVVIKKMTANKGQNKERFKKEAEILLDLQSPYIVHLYDYFTEAGFRYMVEELVDGIAVDSLIKKQSSLPCPIAMLIIQDACFALKLAHFKGIVHRDIKPGNILISKDGEIKLADFGIASDLSSSDLTETGIALGTPAYMPPEQFEDSASVDKRADIYALGIMLYEMITGTKPFPTSSSLLETLKTVKKGKYIRPNKIDKSIPKNISSLIHKMIRPKAKNRIQNIDKVLVKVKKYLKQYDVHELRVQLASSVTVSTQYEFNKIEQKDKIKKIIQKSFIATVIFLILFSSLFYSGFFHKTILKNIYSSVNIDLQIPSSLLQNMDLPAKAIFFENDNDKIPEIKNGNRIFLEKGQKFTDNFFLKKTQNNQQKNKTYNVKTVFLKNGDYRVKVVVGPYVWWKSFSVKDKDLVLNCDFLRDMKRKMKISTFAFDSETQKDITEQTEFEILFKNSWQNLQEFDKTLLESASVWKIKAKCKNYKEEVFSLLIDWYQDELVINASLKK